MRIQIREATLADIPSIQRCYAYGDAHHRDGAPWYWSAHDGPARPEAYLRESLGGEGAAILLAEGEDGNIVGLLHLLERASPELPFLTPRRYAVVEGLIVLPEAQHGGIGAALMQRAEAWALERGLTQIELGVWEFNSAAQRLYARLGYATVRRTLWKRLSHWEAEA